MNLRRAAVFVGLTAALCLSVRIASAEDAGSSVAKTPSTPPAATGSVDSPQNALKPAQDLSDPAEVPGGEAAQAPAEIDSTGVDEGAGWDAAVEAAPGPTPLIGEQQDAAVQKINAYFNGITSLQGNFEQIDSNNKRATGRFYVMRPGKLRFDYAPPSTLRIVSDGHSLAIEDSSLKTIEKYPLESTPFRLLLGEGVDLARDARVVGAEGDEGSLAVTLEDKTGTVEVSRPGGEKIKHTWFGCFAPLENPEIVVVVLVEEGESGGLTAAPIVKKVLERWVARKKGEKA